MAVQSSTWASRLFDCNTPENAGLCCYGLFCAPCLYGQNVESLPREEVCCGGNAWGSCLVFSLLGAVGAHCLVHSRTRRWIRNKYNISGRSAGDFFITWCCAPCALAQETRELRLRKTQAVEYGFMASEPATQQI